MKPLPTCANFNCANTCEMDYSRPRPFCSRCRSIESKNKKFPAGVSSWKKNICENHDGRLGWLCSTDFTKIPSWGKGLTEVDHIDGDPWNNVHENLQELCSNCHKLKGQQHKDYLKRKGALKCEPV